MSGQDLFCRSTHYCVTIAVAQKDPDAVLPLSGRFDLADFGMVSTALGADHQSVTAHTQLYLGSVSTKVDEQQAQKKRDPPRHPVGEHLRGDHPSLGRHAHPDGGTEPIPLPCPISPPVLD